MYEEIIPLINQVGFPIMAFLLMFYLVSTTIKDNTIALQELKEMLRDCKGLAK